MTKQRRRAGLISVDKVQTIITNIGRGLVVMFPVLGCPVLGNLGPLCVQVLEVKPLEDEERHGNDQRTNENPHATDETRGILGSEDVGSSNGSDVDRDDVHGQRDRALPHWGCVCGDPSGLSLLFYRVRYIVGDQNATIKLDMEGTLLPNNR